MSQLQVNTITNAAGTGAPNFSEGLTLSTSQIMQADTITNAAGSGAPNFSHGVKLSTSQVLQADTIENAAGTGAPNFPNSLTSAGQIPITSGSYDIANAPYTILTTDGYNFIEAKTTLTASRTVTLPAAASSAGRKITFIKQDSTSFIMTIACAGSDTINGGASTYLLYAYSWLTIVSDGTNWFSQGASDFFTNTGSAVAAGGTNTATTIVALQVPAGTWRYSGLAYVLNTASTVTAATNVITLGITTTTNSFTGSTSGVDQCYFTQLAYSSVTSSVPTSGVIPSKVVTTTAANTTFYLVGNIIYSGSAPTWTGSLQAVRLF